MKYSTIRSRLIKSMMRVNEHDLSPIMTPLLKFSTQLFSVGMSYDLFVYIGEKNPVLIASNAVSLLLTLLIFAIFRWEKINVNRALILNVWVVAFNMYITILAKALQPVSDSPKTILVAMCIFIIPTILSGVTSLRYKSLFFTFGALSAYVLAGILLKDPYLLRTAPTFLVVIIGMHIQVLYLIRGVNQVKKDNRKMTQEQQALVRFFNLKPEEMKMIKEGRMDTEIARQIYDRMEKTAQAKIMFRLREMVQTQEEIKALIRECHQGLSALELQLCCYIVEGKSVTEISLLREVTISAVTLARSRLRKKFGLKPEDSLRDYLESIVRGSLQQD